MTAYSEATRPLCCLPVETKVRDLDARLHLGLQCTKHGCGCLIGSKSGVKSNMYGFSRPIIYFDKGLDPYNPDFYERLLQSGGGLVLLEEEGGVFPKDYDWVLVAYDKPFMEKVDLVCMWGSLQRDILLAHRKDLDHERVLTTGHPRFDMRKPDFFSYYAGLNPAPAKRKPYILFNSNLAVYNGLRSLEEENAIRKKLYAHMPEHILADLTPHYDYQKILFDFIVENLRETARRYPNMTVICRPHPTEKIETYREVFKDCPNILVTGEGSVQEWIIHAELVLHHDCTTAIEALFYGVPAVALLPVHDPELSTEMPILISHQCESQESFFALMDRVVRGERIMPSELHRERLQLVSKIIANTDFNATDLIVGKVAELASRVRYLLPEPPKPGAAIRAKQAILRLVRTFLPQAGARNGKMPGLARTELEMRIKLLRAIDPCIPEVTVKTVAQDTFLIEPR